MAQVLAVRFSTPHETSDATAVDIISAGGLAVAPENNNWWSVAYGNGTFVAVATTGTNRIMYATNPDGPWTVVTSAPQDSSWRSVTYGDGKFVAVANTGTYRVMYATDPTDTWTPVTAPGDHTWRSVTYGDGKFVAVANTGFNRVMHSSNGTSWTLATSADETTNWYSVTYGDNKFVAIGSNGTNYIMYATDPAGPWTAPTPPVSNGWLSITYGGSKFVAVANSGTNRVLYSTDAINWTLVEASENNTWSSVTYGKGKFVAVARDGTNRIMYATDPAGPWTAAAAAEDNNWNAVTYGDDKFVAVASNGTNCVMYSHDGVNWGDLTKLTLTNDKAYNAETGDEIDTIDNAFKAGTKVTGDGEATVFADSPAFTTTIYSGNGVNGTLLETGIDNTGKSMVWFKGRGGASYQSNRDGHKLLDSERENFDAWLHSDDSDGQALYDFVDPETNGFTIKKSGNINNASVDYVAWNFRAAPGFFDVVTYEGTGSAQDISHALGSKPGMMYV